MRARHRAVLTILFLAIAMGLCAEELPRKAKAPRETYPGADVIYDSITTPDGKRLRTIVTKPRDAKGKVPVIFVAGWLSCDSVEAPAGIKDESGLVFRGLAQLPEFALFRMDKQGVGDSELLDLLSDARATAQARRVEQFELAAAPLGFDADRIAGDAGLGSG